MCCRTRTPSSPYLPSTPAVSAATALSWATRPGWRNSRYIPGLSFALHPRQVRWVVWRARRARPSCCVRRRAITISLSRPWEWGRARLLFTRWSTSSCLSSSLALATSCRASSVASWRWPTVSSSTRPTATTSSAPILRRRSFATRCTSSPCHQASGVPRCCATRATMSWASRRCGT